MTVLLWGCSLSQASYGKCAVASIPGDAVLTTEKTGHMVAYTEVTMTKETDRIVEAHTVSKDGDHRLSDHIKEILKAAEEHGPGEVAAACERLAGSYRDGSRPLSGSGLDFVITVAGVLRLTRVEREPLIRAAHELLEAADLKEADIYQLHDKLWKEATRKPSVSPRLSDELLISFWKLLKQDAQGTESGRIALAAFAVECLCLDARQELTAEVFESVAKTVEETRASYHKVFVLLMNSVEFTNVASKPFAPLLKAAERCMLAAARDGMADSAQVMRDMETVRRCFEELRLETN
jgi:hypothetical protein